LTRELRALAPHVAVSGLGGPAFAAAGGELIADYRGLAVTGLTEALAKIPQSLATLRRLVAFAREHRPDVLVVIDFPDFNFRLARQVKQLGIPVVYYITPQVWAWRRGRLKAIREFADRVLVIFPFEEAIYRDARVPVEFVGHPLVELAAAGRPRAAFLSEIGLAPNAPTVAILPGSRPNEVRRILPDLLAAAKLIAQQLPAAQFVVARAPNLDDHLFDVVDGGVASNPPKGGLDSNPNRGGAHAANPAEAGSHSSSSSTCRVIEGETDTVLAAADVALTASGTATVQTALHGTPMVVVYRLSPLTYKIGRPFVKVDMFAMVNLIAGERIVPELIQDAFTPDAVAAEAVSLLTDERRQSHTREALARVRSRLGAPGASRRAAEAILQIAGAHA
jgi:lipid-A-disaccharide synthase